MSETKAQGVVLVRFEGMRLTEEKTRFAGERITQHENAIYQNVGFFLTLSTAIVGALGYLALPERSSIQWWRIQTIAWSLWYLEVFVAVVFALMIFLHYVSIRRHWEFQAQVGLKDSVPSRWHLFKHMPLYFSLAALALLWGLHSLMMVRLFM
jgi:hypothetical protein